VFKGQENIDFKNH